MPPFDFSIDRPLAVTSDGRAQAAALGAEVGAKYSIPAQIMQGVERGLDLREQYERIRTTYSPDRLAAEQLKRELEAIKVAEEMKRIQQEAELKRLEAKNYDANAAADRAAK